MLPRLLASRSSSRPASFGSRGGFIWISWSEIAVLTSPQNTHTHDAHCAPTRPRRLRTCTLSPCLVTVPLLLLAGRSAARLPGQQPPLARTAAHPLLLLRAAPGRANGASRSGPPCSRPRPSTRTTGGEHGLVFFDCHLLYAHAWSSVPVHTCVCAHVVPMSRAGRVECAVCAVGSGSRPA